MPVFLTQNHDGQVVKRYQWPAEYVTPHDEIYGFLIDLRRAATRDREMFLSYQKAHVATDRELARFFKGAANDALGLVRAVTLALPWLGRPDAGQITMRPLMWPVDLAPQLDEIARNIRLKFG